MWHLSSWGVASNLKPRTLAVGSKAERSHRAEVQPSIGFGGKSLLGERCLTLFLLCCTLGYKNE